jgi:glycogen phosphorylase
MDFQFSFPHEINPKFQKRVAYFSMEFGIDQPLKTYAGGLGYLAGSHFRCAYELKQNIVGIGILWKYGYYDQVRKQDQTMGVLFQEKSYGFLEETNIKFTIKVSKHDVWVTAYYLPPSVFNTSPIFLLSTDLPENDYLAQTICHKLYDANPETRIAASILLGIGGAKLLEMLNWEPEIYHLNESHGLPVAFYLHNKYKNLDEVKKHLVFTNHTPEAAGNQKSNINLLDKMGFFHDIPLTEVNSIVHPQSETLNYSLTALQMAKKANAVSKMHQKVLQEMFKNATGICEILSITNSQNFAFWHDISMYEALAKNDDGELLRKKRQRKRKLFEVVADQCGEIYDERIFTMVFARRFAGYKRADLFVSDMARFHRLLTNKERPVQIVWAGKPYPMDYYAIGTFDKIVNICKNYKNCSILTGYEIKLSKLLKKGADVWLNLPRVTHEASGTSGMTAAMNGTVNVSMPDGWFPEFAKDKINSFVIPACDISLSEHEQDELDANSLFEVLENEVLPMYYDYPNRWTEIMKNGMRDIIPNFDSSRMAREYYEMMYL